MNRLRSRALVIRRIRHLHAAGPRVPVGARMRAERELERRNAELQARIAEQAMQLQEAHEFYQQILASAEEGIIVYGPDLRYRFWNPFMERYSGIPASEVLGRQPAEVFPFLRGTGVLEGLQQALAGKVVGPFEVENRPQAGGEIRFATNISAPLRDHRGGILGVIGTIRDVTAAKQAEQALVESEAKFRALFEGSMDALMTFSPEAARFTSCNPAALRLFQVPTEAEFKTLGPWDLSPPDQADGRSSAEAGPERVAAALDEGFLRFEWSHLRRDGTRFPAIVQLARIDLGGPPFLFCTVRDISDQRRAEQELIENNAALARAYRMNHEFLSAVTHELRTPLHSILGFAAMLKDEIPGMLNPRQAGFASDILDSAYSLLALVNDILEFARLEEPGSAAQREPVLVAAAIAECLEALRDMARAGAVTLGADPAPGLGSAELDPRALHRMLHALVENAIKFNHAGGHVQVSARRAGDAVEIAVADTGIGIAAADLPRLFKPFVQLDASSARRYGGVGIGLAIAHRWAELLGGTLAVQSEPGRGSRFTLRLPAGAPP